MKKYKYIPEIVEASKPLHESQMNRQGNASDLKEVIRRVEGLLEIGILTLLYFFIWRYFYRGRGFYHFYGYGKYVLVLVYIFLLAVILFMSDGFQYGHRKLTEVAVSQWIAVVLVNAITYLQLCLIGNRMLTVLPMLLLTVIDIAVSSLLSFLFTKLYHRMYTPKDMLMIYGSENSLDLKFKMDERKDKYVITKLISCSLDLDSILEEIPSHDAVIINDVPAKKRNDILKYCYQHEVRTYLVPKISDIIQRGGSEITLFDTPLYLIKGRGLNQADRFFKRAFDLLLAVIVLIPALLVMAVIAVAIKREDHGPVFYTQERVTKDGRIFQIIKFRSMVIDAERAGTSIPAADNDPRITKVGEWIRRIRLDEIPQIFNILKGDMSWVGPRPERTENVLAYLKEMPEFACRTKVKAGLTGYAQIYGKYNTSAYDKLRLDLMYIENYSVFLDLKLIMMTPQIMFNRGSTEGFKKAEVLEEKRDELLRQFPDPDQTNE